MMKFQNYCAFQWSIENFSMCIEKSGASLTSPPFEEESSPDQQWCIKLYPRGYNNDDFISIELLKKGQVCGLFNITVSVIDNVGVPYVSREIATTLKRETNTFQILELIKRDDLFKKKLLLLPNDTLTLQCILRKTSKLYSIIESIRLEKLSFTWPIENYSTFKPNCNLTYPLKVSFEKAPKLNLEFSLVENTTGEPEIVIRLQKISNYKEHYYKQNGKYPEDQRNRYLLYLDGPLFISFEISTIQNNKSAFDLYRGDHLFPGTGYDETHSLQRLKIRELFNGENAMLPTDTLFLFFNLQLSNGSRLPEPRCTELEYSQPRKPNLNTYSSNFCKKLYETKDLCDIVLKVGNESLSAHKAVLHSQSPVFRAMLESDMTEKNTGVINIVDFDTDTMKRLLRLLYTGKVDESLSCENILKLYAAAHKYQLSALDEISSSLRISMITEVNIWEIITCAFKYEDTFLKEAAKYFVLNNVKFP